MREDPHLVVHRGPHRWEPAGHDRPDRDLSRTGAAQVTIPSITPAADAIRNL